ncbi:MAG: hypothetical protein HY679_10475 [Chloroflexi bacterium]|nr:hypothetical protein [Chloroflexota bacterium]
MNCPSCGQPTPPGDTCAHCGATLAPARRLPLGVIKWAVVFFAVAGVAALIVSAAHTAVPHVAIGDIGATMNLAYVQISGTVVSAPTYDAASSYLSFRVDDGTGALSVAAYRAETRSLLSAARVPALGDQVTLEGTLRLRDDSTGLTLAAPERLTVQHPAPQERLIASITANDDQKAVTIKGQVRGIRTPYPGLTLYTVRDTSGEIDAALSGDTVALTGPAPELAVGDPVQLTGIVTLYRDTPQLGIPASHSLVKLDTAITLAAARQTGSLNAADDGALVQVVGTLGAAEPFAAGVRFSLDDGTGPVELLLWIDLYAQLGDLSAGSTVQVVGAVSVYRNTLELTPSNAADVKVLTAAEAAAIPTPAPVPSPQPGCGGDALCTAVAGAVAGQTFTVQGGIVVAQSYAQGFEFGLRDATGAITLLLPEAIYKAIPGVETLRPGAVVRASGRVSLYRGDTQIQPAAADQVTIITPGAPPAGLPIAIGHIALGDVNDTLTVEGRIAAVEIFSKGKRLTVSDGTGAITLLLWQNVLNYVPHADQLAAGAPIRVTGLIQEYQGALEIVPQIGFDVIVTP